MIHANRQPAQFAASPGCIAPVEITPSVAPGIGAGGGVGGVLDTVAHARWEDFLPTLPDACVDLVAIDPPYGQTHCEWDTMPDFPTLWRELRRVCKGAVVMTANQPFTTDAINSNRDEFRYSWVWNKESAANFASVGFMPLRVHEDVLVFRQGAYNPQKTLGAKNHPWKPGQRMKSDANRVSVKAVCDESGMKWPKSIITVPKHTSRENLHVSQKPLGLMRYLVETYSNPGDVVLDCFAGSGSTLVAAREVGRRFIGCEMLSENIRTIHARLSQSELFGPLGGGGRGVSVAPATEKQYNDDSATPVA